MTHQEDYTVTSDLAEKGLEAVPELMRILINNVMQVERSKYLQAEEYERTEDRKGHANGYKPKTVRTRIGEITFAVPQVREGGFYPSALEKGLRSERALVTTLAEMYVQGVSTRKVKAITEGISTWPTEFIRLFAFLLGGYLLLRGWRGLERNQQAIARSFFLQAPRAEIAASITQQTTSLVAAAEIATTPSSWRVSPNSRKMRPRMGTAVIARPTPKNRL